MRGILKNIVALEDDQYLVYYRILKKKFYLKNVQK